MLGYGWAAEVGATVLPVKLFVTRGVGDLEEEGDGGSPQVVLVTQRRAENVCLFLCASLFVLCCLRSLVDGLIQTLVDTVIFHIDAITGEDVRKVSRSGEIFQGFDIISGPIIEAFLLQNKTKTVLLLDEFMQVNNSFSMCPTFLLTHLIQ